MLKEREKNKFCMHILGAITGHEGMKKITQLHIKKLMKE